jgi:signal peptidase I
MGRADELAVQVLHRGHPLRIKTRGGSMLPFVRAGDVALVMPTAPTGIGVGDVVCYEAPPGRLFVHRVIHRARNGFLAKGDALACADVIEPAQLLGKVVAIERHGRLKRLDSRIARGRNRVIAFVSRRLPLVFALAIHVGRSARAAWRG